MNYDTITNTSVIDAVNAGFQQARRYEEHWDFYMNAEQKESFSNNVRYFAACCNARRAWLEN